MTWLDAYLAPVPSPGARGRARSVRITKEFERIRAIPRRQWEGRPEVAELQDALTERLRIGPCPPPGVPARLLPAQAIALLDLATMGGAFVPLVTGGGKTLLSLLCSAVAGAKRPVLFVPKRLVAKTKADLLTLAQYWKIPSVGIYNYELLPHRKTLLADLDPDLLILDECHALKNRRAARTKIVRALRKSAPNVPVVAMSGSMMARDIRDFAHIMKWCLREHTVLPSDWQELEEWAYATAEKIPEDTRVDGAAFHAFADPSRPVDPDPLRSARQNLATRIATAPGVVSSTTDLPSAGLQIAVRRLELDGPQKALIGQLIKDRRVPNGAPCESPLDLWRHQRALAVGLWQYWDPAPPVEWLLARRAWAGLCYEVLSRSRTLYSPMDVAKACKSGQLPDGSETYRQWCEIRNTFVPQTKVEWISNSSLEYAAEWLLKEHGLCWVSHVAFGDRLSEMTGIPYFREGAKAKCGTYLQGHKGAAIASVYTCHEGLNLQQEHHKNLVISPTTNAQAEQWISRTHRKGQPEDDVYVDVVLRCEGDERIWLQALADARNVEDTLAQPKRLAIATIIDEGQEHGN
jgi:hypothetical protein